MSKIAVIIPARIGSTRLLRKPLIDIEGKPMLILCAEQAKNANIGDVYIACDCQELADLCKVYGYNYILTDPAIATGSDREYPVYRRIRSAGESTDITWSLTKTQPIFRSFSRALNCSNFSSISNLDCGNETNFSRAAVL